MGLLDKALQTRDASATTPRKGLLARAESARQVIADRVGLFERARRLREETSKKGLFRRALSMQQADDSRDAASVTTDELQDDAFMTGGLAADSASTWDSVDLDDSPTDASPLESFFDDETIPEAESADAVDPSVATDLSSFATDSLFSDDDSDESITLTADELADLEGPLRASDEATSDDNATDEMLNAEAFGDLPDFSFDDQSADGLDPASFEPMSQELDPFQHWEQEAAREAESRTRELTGERDRDRRLFEDEEIMTTPVETHIGSQKRIDNYLALFELNKELHSIDDIEDFWDAALYSILGQVGARTVLIFAGVSGRPDVLYPVAQSGLSSSDEWNMKKGDLLYDALSQADAIRYAGEFLKNTSGISAMEREILEKSRASVLMPLHHAKQLLGVILVGPPLERADYVIDDLEYLRLLSSGLIGPLERIKSIQKHREETQSLARQNVLHRSLADLTASLQTRKTVDEIYDLVLEYFKKNLAVDSLSLVLLDPSEQAYKIFAGSRISPESLKRFHLPVSGSELVGTVSNLSGVYNLVEFRKHAEIVAAYSGDDLALMQHYWILPLINLNWLVGFLTVHHTERPWTEDEREIALIACAQLAPILANCLILSERETLFRDPFSPLEKRLEREVQKALEFHSFLSIIDFRVKNLKKVLGANNMTAMTDYFQALSRTVSRTLHQTDYMSRTGAGRYVLLLPGRGRNEASIFADRLQIELKQAGLLRGSAVAPTYSVDVINFPDDGDSLQKLIALLDR